MEQHHAIMLLCAVLAVGFYAIGLGMLSGVAILAGLPFEAMFWMCVGRTRPMRARLEVDAAS